MEYAPRQGMGNDFIAEVLGMPKNEVSQQFEEVKHWEEISALLFKPRPLANSIAKKLRVSPLAVEAVKM